MRATEFIIEAPRVDPAAAKARQQRASRARAAKDQPAQPGMASPTAQPTLAQAAAANRKKFARDVGNAFKSKMPQTSAAINKIKGAWQGLKNKAIDKSMLASRASQFSDSWEEYAKQAQVDLTDLNAYKDALNDWLTQTLKVNLNRRALDRFVTSTNPGATDRYFEEYFIPRYLKTQQQTAQQTASRPQGATVPAGQRIVVVDPKTRGKYYKTAQGWTNETGQPINKESSIDYLEQLVTNDPVRYEPA